MPWLASLYVSLSTRCRPSGTFKGEKPSVQLAALLGERSGFALAVSGLVQGEGAPGRGGGDVRLEQLYMDALGGWRR
jgi:hypothetical protein